MRLFQDISTEAANEGGGELLSEGFDFQSLLDGLWTGVQGILKSLGTSVQEHSSGVAVALAIFIIGRIVAKIVAATVRKVLNAREVDPMLVGFVSNIIYSGLLVLIVIQALGKVGADTSSFAAILGAMVFAIGFALQGSLGNFAAGVMLMIFRPFKVGDFVEAGGESGAVLEVDIFATTMKTGDNKKIIIPNNSITGGNITNYSANPTRRVDMVVGIGYDDDIRLAKQTLEALIAAEPRCHAEPAPTVAVSELGDNSVNLVVRPWCDTSDYWGVYFDLTEKIKLTFDEKGISFPYPQQDVHMHNVA